MNLDVVAKTDEGVGQKTINVLVNVDHRLGLSLMWRHEFENYRLLIL